MTAVEYISPFLWGQGIELAFRRPDQEGQSHNSPGARQISIPGCIHEQRMPLDIQFSGGNRITSGYSIAHSIQQALKFLADLVPFLWIQAFDGLSHGKLFQRSPKVQAIPYLVPVEAGDIRAILGTGCYQPLLFKNANGLTDGCPAHAQLFGQFLLRDLFPGFEFSLNNGIPDGTNDLVSQRRLW